LRPETRAESPQCGRGVSPLIETANPSGPATSSQRCVMSALFPAWGKPSWDVRGTRLPRSRERFLWRPGSLEGGPWMQIQEGAAAPSDVKIAACFPKQINPHVLGQTAAGANLLWLGRRRPKNFRDYSTAMRRDPRSFHATCAARRHKIAPACGSEAVADTAFRAIGILYPATGLPSCGQTEAIQPAAAASFCPQQVNDWPSVLDRRFSPLVKPVGTTFQRLRERVHPARRSADSCRYDP
jgi:hypothetical protein